MRMRYVQIQKQVTRVPAKMDGKELVRISYFSRFFIEGSGQLSIFLYQIYWWWEGGWLNFGQPFLVFLIVMII